MTTTPPSPVTTTDRPWLGRVHRGQIVAVAVIGILLGVIGLIFTGATLLTVAILFGSFLVAAGVFRIMAAVTADDLPTSLRWLSALLGVLVVIAGILCLSNPWESLVVLAFVIGIGWIADGIVDLTAGLRNAIRPRWFGYVSGIVSIAAGVAMFVLPAAGLSALVLIGAVLLIVLSVTTLLMIPRRARTA
ncbi:MAG: DUF308 domain-containing protein [Actinomycetota bacterium]|nr:DUF308 domain-containing protein [Actinomycetota bacterium]